jgi:RimJ/RimL family protein N-acetyltransferase
MTPFWPQQGSDLHHYLGDFVSQRIWREKRSFGFYTALGVVDKNNTIVAGMIYHNYEPDAGVIEVSGAADTARWLTKPVLWEMFDFPFNQLKCQTVAMRVDPSHKQLSRILPSYGFSKHILPRLRGRNKDECVYLLHDDVWRENGFHPQKKDVA